MHSSFIANGVDPSATVGTTMETYVHMLPPPVLKPQLICELKNAYSVPSDASQAQKVLDALYQVPLSLQCIG